MSFKNLVLSTLILSLGSISALADSPLRQGDQFQGRLYINNVAQNASCVMQVFSANDDSQTGVGCYNYTVQISEAKSPIQVVSIVNKIDEQGVHFCTSVGNNIDGFYVESERTNQHLIVEFDTNGKLKYYNLAKLTGLISTTVYRCQFE